MTRVVAKNYLCFYALLEMIIDDIQSTAHFSQYDLAELFGITIPIGEKMLVRNITYSNDASEYGSKICVEKVNNFLREHFIPLQATFIYSNCLDEMTISNTIVANVGQSYVIFAFCYGVLYNEPHNINIGHVSLLEEIDEKADTIKMYDPGPRNPGSKTVRVDDMLYAMKKRGGIYLFKKTCN